MAKIDTDIDCMACELIEQIPGKVSGRLIIRGTRILPDPIAEPATSRPYSYRLMKWRRLTTGKFPIEHSGSPNTTPCQLRKGIPE